MICRLEAVYVKFCAIINFNLITVDYILSNDLVSMFSSLGRVHLRQFYYFYTYTNFKDMRPLS